MLPRLLNTAWMLRCAPSARAFDRATRDVARRQQALLLTMLRYNADTEFGRAHGFGSIRDARAYQDRVPLRRYEDMASDIERLAQGESQILTRDPVTLFEPTSGSAGGRKLIPYTAALQRQFQSAINPWIANLFAERPAARAGRAYWSISPALGPPETTAAGIPIGFEDDTAYLGLAGRLAMRHLLAVPPAVARMADLEDFRYTTLLHLLGAHDLALISVWSPTFLTGLLQNLEPWGERIATDLVHGTISLPGGAGAPVERTIRPRRDRRVADILRSGRPLPEQLRDIWPRLALVSCWADASAAPYLQELTQLLPGVEIQPKGLIATEGCVSFPLVGEPGAALAIQSHFFEFIPLDEGSPARAPLLAHELSQGSRYEVVLTTGGGLYRYRTDDIVEVVGFRNECPLLRFTGRTQSTSDLVGEKLHEVHVRDVLDRVFGTLRIAPSFALVVPTNGEPPRYRLYLQLPRGARRDWRPEKLARAIEAGLGENPYYKHAVALGQLGPFEVYLLPDSPPSAWECFEQVCRDRGQKVGDIKPRSLDPGFEWPDALARFERAAEAPRHPS